MLEYLQISHGVTLPDISRLRPCKSLVVIESLVSAEWQMAVSRWLVRTGCLYMMVWGNQCTTWDDSVDLANLEAFDFGDIPEKVFVVTTWHPSEPLEDVFWIAKNFSFHFYDVELDNTIILHVSDSSRSDELLEMYANA